MFDEFDVLDELDVFEELELELDDDECFLVAVELAVPDLVVPVLDDEPRAAVPVLAEDLCELAAA